MIQISLNGEIQKIDDSLSLGQLVQQLQINPQQVAIARNLEVILRSKLHDTFLNDGDDVEIFHAVGGG